MPVVLPETLDELRTVTAGGDVVLLAGGTDLMVALNHRARVLPPDTTVVGLSAIPELATWSHEPSSGEITIGACVTWADLERPPFDQLCPALAQAAVVISGLWGVAVFEEGRGPAALSVFAAGAAALAVGAALLVLAAA